jgi:hypothetical protein
MLTFLDDNNIPLKEAYWRDWEHDYPKFTEKVDALGIDVDYTGELAQAWSNFLSAYVWDYLPRTSYELSDKWLREVGYT